MTGIKYCSAFSTQSEHHLFLVLLYVKFVMELFPANTFISGNDDIRKKLGLEIMLLRKCLTLTHIEN